MDRSLRANWEGDVLERKGIADFLYRLLIQKFEASRDAPNAGALCMSLDGPWGCGKSFFITKWAEDLKLCGHPVVVFDAWRNDLSEEPLMGFVASLQNELKGWAAQVPVAQRARANASKIARDAFRKAGRAVVPISGLLTKGLLKKIAGIELNEWTAVLSGDPSISDDELSETANDPSKITGSDLIDEYFKVSLEDHSQRIRAIDDLKKALGELLAFLESHAKANLPMFVLIDELDRCRPSYAIELLEGVKHLFDVKGLCFCVSTNLVQLGESIKGVYGGGFDAHRYLKRFFSFEYVLPDPNDHAFAMLLTRAGLIKTRKNIFTGLSDAHTGNVSDESIAKAFHLISRAFRLDLRSQRQVFDIAEAASTGVPSDKALHIFYLFSLAAVRHIAPEAFATLQWPDADVRTFDSIARLMDASCKHSYEVSEQLDSPFRTLRKVEVEVIELLKIYVELARRDVVNIHERYYAQESRVYPKTIERSIADEIPQTYNPRHPHPPSIQDYARLIRTAGQIAPTES